MTKTYSLSRFAIPFHRDGKYLLFSSKTCNFYELDRGTYDFLEDLRENPFTASEKEDIELLDSFRAKGITIYPGDDEAFFDKLQFINNLNTFSKSALNLTIAPTVSCNLRCPYCFETKKPSGVMSVEVADSIIKYIESHQDNKWVDITWFGGEPLLCPDIIEYILEKITGIEGKELRSHSIITNGTKLKNKAMEIFCKYPLSSLQITLDGMKTRHDSIRFYADNKGTYDDIIENIDIFTQKSPQTRVNIRINVDNNNRNKYAELYRLLTGKFPGRNIYYYPGILRANKGCESETFFSSKDHFEFMKELRDCGASDSLFPTYNDKGCCATCASAHVIGPFGELYRCWEHIGKQQYIVGNIADNTMPREHLLLQYIKLGTPFSDKECKKCPILPICNGGCAYKRIENLLFKGNNDLCCIYHNNNMEALKDILYTYYKLQKNHNTNPQEL